MSDSNELQQPSSTAAQYNQPIPINQNTIHNHQQNSAQTNTESNGDGTVDDSLDQSIKIDDKLHVNADSTVDELVDQLSNLIVTEPAELPTASTEQLIHIHNIQLQRTGIVYDERCLLHSANYIHVEQPARISQSMKLLLNNQHITPYCQHYSCRLATTDELLCIHPQSHIDMLDSTLLYKYKLDEPDSDKPGDNTLYTDCHWLDNDTYVNRYSAYIARLAVGGLIDLTNKVVTNELENGFAIIRPPGHHSSCSRSSGFCLYNNVAVAADNVLKHHNDTVKRVAIIDWDVHHGDGTQDIFYNRSDVLYFSIHRYQNRTFYPYTGGAAECGSGNGLGYTVNCPLTETQMSDAQYIDCFDNLLMPILQQYQPDLIYISAGFDCATGDPLGGNEVSTECFAHLTHKLMDQSLGHHGRVICALEGGYNCRAVSESVLSCITALTHQPLPKLPNSTLPTNSKHALKLQSKYIQFKYDLRDAIIIQSKYWKLHPIDIPAIELRRSSRQSSTSTSTTPITSPNNNNTTTSALPANFKSYIKQQRSTGKKDTNQNNNNVPSPNTNVSDTIDSVTTQLHDATITTPTTITSTQANITTTTVPTDSLQHKVSDIHYYTSKLGKRYFIIPYNSEYRNSTLDCIGRVQGEYTNLAGLTVNDQPDVLDIPTHFQSGNGCFYIAIDSNTNTVIGTSGLKLLNSTQAALRKMYVDSSYRGQGVGYQLLQITLQYSDTNNINDVYLGTSLPMIDAHKFYSNNGFHYIDVSAMPTGMPLTLKFDTVFMHRNKLSDTVLQHNNVQSSTIVKNEL